MKSVRRAVKRNIYKELNPREAEMIDACLARMIDNIVSTIIPSDSSVRKAPEKIVSRNQVFSLVSSYICGNLSESEKKTLIESSRTMRPLPDGETATYTWIMMIDFDGTDQDRLSFMPFVKKKIKVLAGIGDKVIEYGAYWDAALKAAGFTWENPACDGVDFAREVSKLARAINVSSFAEAVAAGVPLEDVTA